jgi:hypothetical protein
MKSLFLIFFCISILPNCFGQNSPVAGHWQSSGSLGDTFSLAAGGSKYNFDYREYLDKKYDTVDTTCYWHFSSPDSLAVEYVIRTFRIIPLERPDTVPVPTYTLVGEPEYYAKQSRKERKAISRALKKSDFAEFSEENSQPQKDEKNSDSTLLMIDGKQYRIRTTTSILTSCWSIEKGRWQLVSDHLLQISGTTLFNGTYRIRQEAPGKMKLIRQ